MENKRMENKRMKTKYSNPQIQHNYLVSETVIPPEQRDVTRYNILPKLIIIFELY